MSRIISVHIILIFSYLISHTGIREYVKCFLKLISCEMCFKCLSSPFILRFTFRDFFFFSPKFLSPCPQPLKIKQDKEVSSAVWGTSLPSVALPDPMGSRCEVGKGRRKERRMTHFPGCCHQLSFWKFVIYHMYLVQLSLCDLPI